jgi:regulator of sigma E protease
LNNKPVWQRFAVFAAGPSMNLVLAVLLYALVAATGAEIPETQVDCRIGEIQPDSPAAQAPMFLLAGNEGSVDANRPPDAVGWQTGDRILRVGGQAVSNISDVAMSAALSGGKSLAVVLERVTPDGKTSRYLSPVQPKVFEGEELLRFGIEPFETAVVKGVATDMPAYASGIKPGDVIARADGKWVDIATFVKTVESVPEGDTLDIEFERGGETLHASVQPKTRGRFLDMHFAPVVRSEREVGTGGDIPVQVAAVNREAAERTGIRSGDLVVEIDGQPATIDTLREYEALHPGQHVKMKLLRPALLFGLLRRQSVQSVELNVASVRVIGVELGQKMVFHRVPPLQVVPQALRDAYQDFARTMRTLTMLVTGKVSPKSLGGPVMIYQVTTKAAEAGYWWLVRMTAFISVNLFVFNLLPLPILDGGQIVLLAAEGVRRKPVNTKFIERFQQVGLVFIIGLMLFVTYNDILRWIRSLVD